MSPVGDDRRSSIGDVMIPSRLLRRRAASEYLLETHGLERAPSTLAKLAVIGGGPLFRRIGRVPLYAPEDLDRWVALKLSPPMRSTSEALTLNASPNEDEAVATSRQQIMVAQ